MGTYALQRAILRHNEHYAAIEFGKAIRWGVQLAFILERNITPTTNGPWPTCRSYPGWAHR